MDPSIIAALSGAPATVVLVYLIIFLVKDHKAERKDFLSALMSERKAIERLGTFIQRQSALLIVVAETIAPGRSANIQRQVEKLFQTSQPEIVEPSDNEI